MRKTYYWNPETKTLDENRPLPKEQVHYVQDDTMPATRHPVTGQVMDSKSAFRRETKARGYTEVGNDWVGKPYQQPEPKFPDPIPVLRELLDH